MNRELSRIKRRPDEPPVHLLALLTVKPAIDATIYGCRLRNVILEALKIAQSVDFEQDDIETSTLPDWFLDVTNGKPPVHGDNSVESLGKRRYMQFKNEAAWSAQEWIYCFDPELRSWSWWDVTDDGQGNICVWVDTVGEAHIPCGELWWAVYAAGAEEVKPLTLAYASEWQSQSSLAVKGF